MWRGRHALGRRCGAGESRRRADRRGRVWWAVVAVGVMVLTVGQSAQGVGGRADAEAGFPGVPGVDEFHGRSVHRLVEEWVRQGGVPGERADAIRVVGALGVRVTLRLDGVKLGEGTWVRPDLAEQLTADGPGLPWRALPVIDLIDLIEPATAEALDDAVDQVRRQRLEARIRAAGDPDAPNVAADVDAAELGPQLTVDVQLAFAPEQVVMANDAPAGMIYANFAPGYHGLFAVPTAGVSAFAAQDTPVWPASALARNASPGQQIVRLLTRCGLKPDDEKMLGRPDGVAVGRFRVLHVVRPKAELPVMRLVRGGQPLPARFVDQQTLGDVAERVAMHLYGRFIGINGEVRGTYKPARGIYDPELASDLEAALASYTLVRYYDWRQREGNKDEFFQALVDASQRTVDRVVGRLLTPDDPPNAVTAAFCLLTILEAPAGTFDPAMDDRVAGLLRGLVDDDGRVLADAAAPDRLLSPAGTGAVLAALGRWYEHTRDPEVGQVLAAALESFWNRQRGPFDVNTLPWVALTHVQASGLLQDAGLIDDETRAQRSAGLAAMNELIAERQVVERPELGPPDVEGGIVFVDAPPGSPPNPNWQTAPLFGFMATTLRDEQIVPRPQRPGTLVTASASARFLGQLMIDDPNCFAIRSPAEAIGGIRLALWDNELDIAPSAITLMAMLEMLETLDVLSGGEAVDE
ncbi:MAG: hypothetical protein AAF911_14150 [Planctomycetota bacterium]